MNTTVAPAGTAVKFSEGTALLSLQSVDLRFDGAAWPYNSTSLALDDAIVVAKAILSFAEQTAEERQRIAAEDARWAAEVEYDRLLGERADWEPRCTFDLFDCDEVEF